MNNRSYYRTHADYLRAHIKGLQRDIEHSQHESHRELCKRLLSRARRKLEFGDVEKETTKVTKRARG